MLNQNTLLLVQVSFTVLITLLLTSVALTKDALNAQRLWAMGNVITCLGIAIGASETLPVWVHGAVSYGFMGLGLAIVLRGLYQFCGLDLSNMTVTMITICAFVLPGYFAVIDPSLRARLLVTGLYFGILNFACAWTLWSRLRDEARAVMWASLAGFASLGVALVARGAYLAWAPGGSQETAQNDLVANATLLVIPIAQVCAGFGLIVMVAHRYAHKLSRLSMLDSLTGAYNRSAMETIALRTLKRAGQAGRSVCIAMLDADHFKKINDTYGHPVGDQVLRHLVEVLTKQLRPSDILVRYGGEEFLLLFDGLNLLGATQVCERLRLAVENSEVTANESTLTYRISIGVSGTDTLGYDLKKLVEAADAALYQAKTQGRNQVCSA